MPSAYVATLVLGIVVGVALYVLLRARRREETRPRASREPSAVVILEGNVWDACAVDDRCEPWGRYTTEPIRGFCGVPAGRHRVRTTTSAGEATLDFVAFPGEVLTWRLDAERARWEPHELDPATRAALDRAPVSTRDLAVSAQPKLPGSLVHLRTTLGLGARAGLAFESAQGPVVHHREGGVERLRSRVARLAGMLESEPVTALDPDIEARAIGEAIVGRPLTRSELRALVAPLKALALRLVASADGPRALRVLGLGLAVLPGSPELMVAAGCALAAGGDAEEALRVLGSALERESCLDADDVARAMRARLELRALLGRALRV